MEKNLAINGGPKTLSESFPPWPQMFDEDVSGVVNVLRSGKVNYWTGNQGRAFEEEFAQICETNYAIALANGTIALEIALFALGIGKGDEVIVTPRSFIASASAAVTVGAKPVFADIDRDSQNITADTIKAVLTKNTKAIIPVHLAGWPCDMDPIMEVAEDHKLFVIEDCAQAHGAKYKGRPVGSIGHVAGFSFCQDKIMTTAGEGGMVVTNDKELWGRIWSLKDHGKDYNTVFNTQHPPGFRWLHKTFGTNLRLSEVQSSVGRTSLRRLSEDIEKRRSNAQVLQETLSAFRCIRLTIPSDEIFHSYYKYYCFIEPSMLQSGWDRDRVMNAISAEGIPCYSGSCSEMYNEQAFDGLRPVNPLPIAKELGETSLMFLVHPTISLETLEKMSEAIRKVLQVASS